MKPLHLLLIALLIFNSACNDDDDLAEATQTGEGTFSCLINGEVFNPDTFGLGAPRAFYQFVDGAFTSGISASSGGGAETQFFNIAGIDVDAIKEGDVYDLIEVASGNFSAEYTIGGGFVLRTSTTSQNPGRLTITRFDPDNFIISGTFEFMVLDDDGNEINITEGRFDMRFTQ